MGRGRAKAKQTKVARELKYSSQGTDFEALQRELASGSVDRRVCADSAEVVSAGSVKGAAEDCASARGAYPPSTQHKMINSAVRRTRFSIRVC